MGYRLARGQPLLHRQILFPAMDTPGQKKPANRQETSRCAPPPCTIPSLRRQMTKRPPAGTAQGPESETPTPLPTPGPSLMTGRQTRDWVDGPQLACEKGSCTLPLAAA